PDTVRAALAHALQLDEAERTHLSDPAATASAAGQMGRGAPGGPGPGRPRRSSSPLRVREGVVRVLDSIGAPAYVRNSRMDVLAANRLGRALFAALSAEGATGCNLARYLLPA